MNAMRYPGGKGKIFQQVINLLPPHTTYVETHLGGGAVLRHKKPSTTTIGIDRDPQIIDFWRRHFPDLGQYVVSDAAEFLSSYPFQKCDVLYCDPPYLPSTRQRSRVYRYDYEEEDHKRLLALLVQLPCRVLISGYPSKLYREQLAGWNTHTFRADSQECKRDPYDPTPQPGYHATNPLPH